MVIVLAAALLLAEDCDRARSASFEVEARRAAAGRKPAEAIRSLELAISACPTDRELLLRLSDAQAGAREFDAAILSARRYLDGAPASATGRAVLARAHLLAGHPRQAMQEAERGVAAEPNNAAALSILANAAYLAGEPGKAIDTFIRLLAAHPNHPDAAYMLGRVYYQEGQVDHAMGQFERALKSNPRSYKALDNLGLCWAARGDDEQATRYYLSAIRIVEKDGVEYEWPYTNLADLLLRSGDTRRAFDAASKAVNRNPMAARAFYVGAKALEQLGKTEESLNWARRSGSIDPDYAESWYLMARLHQRLGQTREAEEARKRFTAAKAKEPAKRR